MQKKRYCVRFLTILKRDKDPVIYGVVLGCHVALMGAPGVRDVSSIPLGLR